MSNPEGDKSLLYQIRYNLALNEDLVVVGETFQATPQNDRIETVRIFVRPDQDLGLDGIRLYEFQRDTIDPLLRPLFKQGYEDRIDRPFYGGGGVYENTIIDLQFGFYALDEIIGRKKHVGRVELELFDEEAKDRLSATENEEFTFQYAAATRAIEVYVLPNDSIAKLVLAYEQGLNQGTVTKDRTLDSLKHGLTADQLRAIVAGESPLPEIRYKSL